MAANIDAYAVPAASHETCGQGKVIIISGPSGCGKTTLVRRLLERHPEYRRSVSVTTRPRRPGEVQDSDYRFVSPPEFDRLLENGELLEWSEHFGNRYGTPRAPVESALAAGAVIILEIDVNGAAQVKAQMPHAYAIFVRAPSQEALAARLRARGTEAEPRIRERLARAEMEMAHRYLFDREVVNDDLDRAVGELEQLVAEARRKNAEH